MERSDKVGSRAKVSPGSATAPGEPDPLVSNALRTAYEEAVKEEVPSEFLDLLNKLA